MNYDFDLSLLSEKFFQEYPPEIYKELIEKCGRPYACLLIDFHDDYFICVPFRSRIKHKNGFFFASSKRTQKGKRVNARSGLDYSKIIIIKDTDYLDATVPPVVDQDEYNEMAKNIDIIVEEVIDYVDTYINHVNKICPINTEKFLRKYQYSTLSYFHNIIGIRS